MEVLGIKSLVVKVIAGGLAATNFINMIMFENECKRMINNCILHLFENNQLSLTGCAEVKK